MFEREVGYEGSDSRNRFGKECFPTHGVDRQGRAVLARRLRREQLLKVLGELEPCLIGIEASTGAFFWQRQFEKLGHTVRIMAPQYVKPFVRRQKNDTNDAEAICTAVQQRNMRSYRRRRSNSRTSRRFTARGSGWLIIESH